MTSIVNLRRPNHNHAMQSWINQFFNNDPSLHGACAAASFKIDIKETENSYLVDAELPGISKDELSLNLNEGYLKIAVNKAEQTEENKDGYLHRERHASSMSRSIYLPDASAESVSAKLNNGILSVTIAKIDKEKNSTKITID